MDYELKTEHFKFKLHVEDNHKPLHMRIFTIGSPDAYCLEATLFMPDVDSRFTDLHICDIAKLDSLSSCLLDEPGSEDISFGAELLYGFINIIKSNILELVPQKNIIKTARIMVSLLDIGQMEINL